MSALSKILLIISKLYLPPFIKMILIIAFEVAYNIFINIFNRKRYNFKRTKTPKTILITGGTKGIGIAIVHTLIKLNYKIIILSRSTDIMSNLQKLYGKDKIIFFTIDLSDIKQLKLILNRIKKANIDIVINNAGAFYSRPIMKRNIEYQFLVNYLSLYIICTDLQATKIVNVCSSVVYSLSDVKMQRYNLFMEHYAQSKLAILMYTLFLKSRGVNACAVHPGIVCTELFDNSFYGSIVRFLHRILFFLFTNVNHAADNVIYAALTEDVSKEKDCVDFYMYLNKADVPSYVNMSNAKKLVKMTKKVTSQL